MSPELVAALARTTHLVRDEVTEVATERQVVGALTNTRIALVCDAQNIRSHSAQSAFVATAILLARSGHQVYLFAPDVELNALQPPLLSRRLVTGLLELGTDMLPGVAFSVTPPHRPVDLQVLFGDSRHRLKSSRTLRAFAGRWFATLGGPETGTRWPTIEWPLGGLLAATLVAAESFKCAMHCLEPFARGVGRFAELFGPRLSVLTRLAPEDTPMSSALREFDCISAGAITNATLFSLSRLPNVTGFARVLDTDVCALSNLNRYLLLRRSHLNRLKVGVLQNTNFGGLEITGIARLFEPAKCADFQFARSVLVGVDHIPSRWAVQRMNPEWLAVGATTHWDAMASFHQPHLACAGCLHPRDDPTTNELPTVAFVSFLAGLANAAYFARWTAGQMLKLPEQSMYATPFHMKPDVMRPVALSACCPVNCSPSNQNMQVA